MNPIAKTCALFPLIVIFIDYAKSNPIGMYILTNNNNRVNKFIHIFFVCSHSIPFYLFVRCLGTGGPTVVTEGKDALLTCVITGSFMNDTVLWRRGNDDILAAGTNRVTTDRRFRVLHDESMFIHSFSY